MARIIKFDNPFCHKLFIAQDKINVLGLHFIKIGFISFLILPRLDQIQKSNFCKKIQPVPVCKFFQLIIEKMENFIWC